MKSSTFDLGLLVLITVDGLEKTLAHGKQKRWFTLDQESMGVINQILTRGSSIFELTIFTIVFTCYYLQLESGSVDRN